MPHKIEQPVIRHFFSFEVDAIPFICPTCTKANEHNEQPNYFGVAVEVGLGAKVPACPNCKSELVPV